MGPGEMYQHPLVRDRRTLVGSVRGLNPVTFKKKTLDTQPFYEAGLGERRCLAGTTCRASATTYVVSSTF